MFAGTREFQHCFGQGCSCRRSFTGQKMGLIFGLLSLITLFSTDVIGKMTTPDGPAMSTISPGFIGNITIGPSIQVNYSMEVMTSGPAVLDSIMVFTARIFSQPNDTHPTGKFKYLWLNTADHDQVSTHGGHNSELRKTFSHGLTGAGDYLMTVVVSPARRPTDIVCFSSIIFKLTNHLNGNLKVKQDLEFQRSNTTFAIDQPIHFHLNMTDRFSKSVVPQYTYFWYNGSTLIHVTYSPHYEHNFSEPNILHLQAVASAEFWSVPSSPASTSHLHIDDKVGSFAEKLHFKESLRDCSLTRMDSTTQDQSLKLGNKLVLNVTCHGSFPSAVCWNVTKTNVTLNETCRPSGQFANTTQNTVTVTIGDTGWKTLHLAVYNDVSFQLLSQNFYVYDAGSVNIPALVFPIVFIILGGIIIAFGATYIVRLRRKMHVEVADFDFDPTISVRSNSSWSNLMPAIRQFFQRSRVRARSTNDERYSINRSRGLYETL